MIKKQGIIQGISCFLITKQRYKNKIIIEKTEKSQMQKFTVFLNLNNQPYPVSEAVDKC